MTGIRLITYKKTLEDLDFDFISHKLEELQAEDKGTEKKTAAERREDGGEEDNQPTKRLAQEARLAKRRFKNRTRQITGDGMMDEILAGLISEPLQAEVHPRRNRLSENS
ncbi:unnamed protein product [Trichobilharzia regenti]|nr:unnamed protein product [Trichobilharzia regenti]